MRWPWTKDPSSKLAEETPIVEQTRVIPCLDFPRQIIVEFQTEDGKLARGRMSPMQGHGLADDIMRAVGLTMKGDPAQAG